MIIEFRNICWIIFKFHHCLKGLLSLDTPQWLGQNLTKTAPYSCHILTEMKLFSQPPREPCQPNLTATIQIQARAQFIELLDLGMNILFLEAPNHHVKSMYFLWNILTMRAGIQILATFCLICIRPQHTQRLHPTSWLLFEQRHQLLHDAVIDAWEVKTQLAAFHDPL